MCEVASQPHNAVFKMQGFFITLIIKSYNGAKKNNEQESK